MRTRSQLAWLGLVVLGVLAACGGGGGGMPRKTCTMTMSGGDSEDYTCLAVAQYSAADKLQVVISSTPIAYFFSTFSIRNDASFASGDYDAVNIPGADLTLTPESIVEGQQPKWDAGHATGATDVGTFHLTIDDTGPSMMVRADTTWLEMTGSLTATLEPVGGSGAAGETFVRVDFATSL